MVPMPLNKAVDVHQAVAELRDGSIDIRRARAPTNRSA
jgi:hypothetical protein